MVFVYCRFATGTCPSCKILRSEVDKMREDILDEILNEDEVDDNSLLGLDRAEDFQHLIMLGRFNIFIRIFLCNLEVQWQYIKSSSIVCTSV